MNKLKQYHRQVLLYYSTHVIDFQKRTEIGLFTVPFKYQLTGFNQFTLAEYYNQVMFIGGSVRSFRYIFGLPNKGQRTWSNGKTAAQSNRWLFNLKFLKYKRLFRFNNMNKHQFIAEYVNMFIYHQWFFEWFSVANNTQRIPQYVYQSNFVDLENLLKHNLYSFYKNPFKNKKQKSHRKKKVYPKNKITIGLNFGFIYTYQNNLNKSF